MKKCVLKDLYDKKNYYLQLKTNRYSMNIVIKEHLDIIQKYIYEIEHLINIE